MHIQIKKTVQQHIAIKPKLSEEDISQAVLVPKMKIRRRLPNLKKSKLYTMSCVLHMRERKNFLRRMAIDTNFNKRKRAICFE